MSDIYVIAHINTEMWKKHEKEILKRLGKPGYSKISGLYYLRRIGWIAETKEESLKIQLVLMSFGAENIMAAPQ